MVRLFPDVAPLEVRHRSRMRAPTYAMYWREGDGPRVAGRIEIDGGSVTLEGTVPPVGTRRVGFGDILRVALERNLIRLDRRVDAPLTIGSLDSPGALRELADRLSEAAAAAGA
jgi:hypothetical protein